MTYTRLEAAKHRKWFIYFSHSCYVVFLLGCAVSFCSLEHVFLSACVHIDWGRQRDRKREREGERKKIIQPTHHHTISTVLLVVFVLVLITINYLIISLYGSFHFGFLEISWQASRTWVSDFFSFSFYFVRVCSLVPSFRRGKYTQIAGIATFKQS